MDILELLNSVSSNLIHADADKAVAVARRQRMHLSQFATAMIVAFDDAASIALIQEAIAAISGTGGLEESLLDRAEDVDGDWKAIGAMIESLEANGRIVAEAIKDRDPERMTEDVLVASDEMRIVAEGLRTWSTIAITPSWDTLCDVEGAVAEARPLMIAVDEILDGIETDENDDEDEDPVIETLRTIESLVAEDAATAVGRITTARIKSMTTDDILTALTPAVRAKILESVELDALWLIPVADVDDPKLMHPMMEAVLRIAYREEDDDLVKVGIAFDRSSGSERTIIDLAQN